MEVKDLTHPFWPDTSEWSSNRAATAGASPRCRESRDPAVSACRWDDESQVPWSYGRSDFWCTRAVCRPRSWETPWWREILPHFAAGCLKLKRQLNATAMGTMKKFSDLTPVCCVRWPSAIVRTASPHQTIESIELNWHTLTCLVERRSRYSSSIVIVVNYRACGITIMQTKINFLLFYFFINNEEGTKGGLIGATGKVSLISPHQSTGSIPRSFQADKERGSFFFPPSFTYFIPHVVLFGFSVRLWDFYLCRRGAHGYSNYFSKISSMVIREIVIQTKKLFRRYFCVITELSSRRSCCVNHLVKRARLFIRSWSGLFWGSRKNFKIQCLGTFFYSGACRLLSSPEHMPKCKYGGGKIEKPLPSRLPCGVVIWRFWTLSSD